MSGRGTLQHAYHESLRQHGYQPDAAQEHAVARLEDLRQRLATAHAASGGWLGRLRRVARRETPAVRGLYLWGGVGRGKTFLMDLFHAALPVAGRRHHFHRFMKDVHGRLGQLRDRENPLEQVAAELAREARVLCLDELYVGDIADAMILGGLFAGLDRARRHAGVHVERAARRAVPRRPAAQPLPARDRADRALHRDAERGCGLRLPAAAAGKGAAVPGQPPTRSREDSLALRFEEIAGEAGRAGRRARDRGPRHPGAPPWRRRRVVRLRGDLRRAAQRGRLRRDRPRLPHRVRVERAGARGWQQRPGAALRRAGRRVLRPQRQAGAVGRGAARGAVPRHATRASSSSARAAACPRCRPTSTSPARTSVDPGWRAPAESLHSQAIHRRART